MACNFERGHLDIYIWDQPMKTMQALYDYCRFCAKVDMIKTEKLHEKIL